MVAVGTQFTTQPKQEFRVASATVETGVAATIIAPQIASNH